MPKTTSNNLQEPINLIEERLIILTIYTIDSFMKETAPADLIALYTFYYFCAKRQQTNRPKALDTFTRKGLHWGRERLETAQEVLKKLGLAEKVVSRTSSGKIKGWYIQLNYLFKEESISHLPRKPQVDPPTSGSQTTNALSVKDINALSVLVSNDTMASTSDTIPTPKQLKDAENRKFVPWQWRKAYISIFLKGLKLKTLDKSEDLNRFAINRIFFYKLKENGDRMEEVHEAFLELLKYLPKSSYYASRITSFVMLEGNFESVRKDILASLKEVK